MKRLIFVLTGVVLVAAAMPARGLYANTIRFPQIDVYTEMTTNFTLSTSYLMDLMVDTGAKYGAQFYLGLKGYNLNNLYSNLVTLSSLKLYIKPFNLFSLGYFLGKNVTLGYTEIGYTGFQYHRRANFEYIGYKNITGNGLELFASLWDEMLEPHLYAYAPNPVVYSNSTSVMTNKDSLNVDTVIDFKTDNLYIEGYLGVNVVPGTMSFYKHLGLFFKTVYGKLDVIISFYLPDSYTNTGLDGLIALPSADDIYLNITEHIIAGNFEQTLTIFSRPSFYNEFQETMQGDLDIYLAMGVRIEDFGMGLENTVMVGKDFNVDDKIGGYLYFLLNNMQYKLGGFYDLHVTTTMPANNPLWGAFLGVTGSL